jgi:hypothetical protein
METQEISLAKKSTSLLELTKRERKLGHIEGLQEIPTMTQQFALFDLGVLGVELIIGGAVALPTVGLGDMVEIPLAGGVDAIILAAELLTVAAWFVGDCLAWAIRVIVALVVLGVQEIIYHVQSPSTTTTRPISITVISGGASKGGETVITNGDGTGADAGGWSTADQADLAWTAADACAAARASYIKRTGNGNINYALGSIHSRLMRHWRRMMRQSAWLLKTRKPT